LPLFKIVGPPLNAALREAREEAGVDLRNLVLEDLGVQEYRRDKALHVFAAKITKASLDLAACKCSSYFRDERSGRDVLEMDAFAWVHKSELPRYCGQNMRRVLGELLSGGLVERLPLQVL
jgi:8-oxo-dGTP pyrophosphatase MutT (NUDIX family)